MADNWNMTMEQGRIRGFLCSGCQTPEENAEAEINLATTEYLPPTADGLLRGRPKM